MFIHVASASQVQAQNYLPLVLGLPHLLYSTLVSGSYQQALNLPSTETYGLQQNPQRGLFVLLLP